MLWAALLAAQPVAMHLGSRGPLVSALQTDLRQLGYASQAPSGTFTAATRQAVVRLQRSRALATDGVAGPEVLGAIVAKVVHNAPLLHIGDRGGAVRDLQEVLTRDGVRTGVDGQFGPQTRRAVLAFQRQRRLSTDGVVGPKTWSALFTRSYRIRPGDTVDDIAARLHLPVADVLAATAGSTRIYAGRTLEIPYAPVVGAKPASKPPAKAAPKTEQTVHKSRPKAKTPPSKPAATPATAPAAKTKTNLIPSSNLGRWGNAGTPVISLIMVASTSQTLRQLQTLRSRYPIAVATTPTLWPTAVSQPVPQVLVTSDLGKALQLHPPAVLWQGRLDAASLGRLQAAGIRVLVAPVRSDWSAPAVAKATVGGRPLVLRVTARDLANIGPLASALTQAGFRIVSPQSFGQ